MGTRRVGTEVVRRQHGEKKYLDVDLREELLISMPLTGMKSNLIEISGTPSMDRLRPSVYRARLHLAFVFLLFFLFLSLLGFFFVFRCGTRWLEKLFRGRIAGAVPHCRMCLLQEKLHERGAVLI